MFGKATGGYVSVCSLLIRRSLISLLFLVGLTVAAGGLNKLIPGGFLPEEDQGYLFAGIQLPNAASLQRTEQAARKVEEILANTPGIDSYASVIGFSMLSQVTNTYSAFFFALKPGPSGRRRN